MHNVLRPLPHLRLGRNRKRGAARDTRRCAPPSSRRQVTEVTCLSAAPRITLDIGQPVTCLSATPRITLDIGQPMMGFAIGHDELCASGDDTQRLTTLCGQLSTLLFGLRRSRHHRTQPVFNELLA